MGMSKEMNWMYVKENYGKIFKETFNMESKVIDIIGVRLEEAKDMSDDELLEMVQRLECEMRFLVDNVTTNVQTASLLSNWCFNMVSNLTYVIEEKNNNWGNS